MQQGHKWVNHVLASYGKPPCNKMHYKEYAHVLDVLRGISKEEKWKSHKTKGAASLTKLAVKSIFEASVRDPNTDELSLVRLRNKALTILVIANGWHTSDAFRLLDNDVEDLEDYEDRDGVHRPKLIFHGRKCKEHVKVKNAISCGCRGRHSAMNTNCWYNVVKWYKTRKEQSDKHSSRSG